MIKKTHNDYWTKRPIIDGLAEGCKIFEADIIWTCGDIYLSHSWRPFARLLPFKINKIFGKEIPRITFGSFLNYYNRLVYYCQQYPKEIFYIYIEFKSGNKKINKRLAYIISRNKPTNLKILVDAVERSWSSKHDRMIKFHSKYKNTLDVHVYSVFFKSTNIDNKHLYEPYKRWWMI